MPPGPNEYSSSSVSPASSTPTSTAGCRVSPTGHSRRTLTKRTRPPIGSSARVLAPAACHGQSGPTACALAPFNRASPLVSPEGSAIFSTEGIGGGSSGSTRSAPRRPRPTSQLCRDHCHCGARTSSPCSSSGSSAVMPRSSRSSSIEKRSRRSSSTKPMARSTRSTTSWPSSSLGRSDSGRLSM